MTNFFLIIKKSDHDNFFLFLNNTILTERSCLFESEYFLRLRLGKSFSMVGSNNDLTLSYFKTGHQKTGRKFQKK